MNLEGSRFSAAAAAADKNGLILNASDGLIQVMIDNFDAIINSQNGMKQTHALALIFAKGNCPNENKAREARENQKCGS